MTTEAPEDPKFSVQAKDIQSVVQVEHVDHLSLHYHSSSPDPKTLPAFLLPHRPEHFINRESELTRLMDELQPGAVSALCGPGGLGKTALAVEAVYRFRDQIKDRFPDGVIFHSFYRQPRVDQALEQIGRLFGEDLEPSIPAAAQRALNQRRLFLILDGAEDADDLEKVMEVAASCGMLITSRHRQDAIAGRQELTVLSPEHSRRLLMAWSQAQAADETATEQISKLLGGLPLALRLAGRYMEASAQNPAEYLSWLKATGLEALDFGQRKFESVPKLLERSLSQVSELAKEIIGLTGVLSFSPFAKEPVVAALELKAPKLVSPLGELVNYGLLLRSDERYELSHALLHTYAKHYLKPDSSVIKRLVNYYKVLACELSEKRVEAQTRLDHDKSHIIHLIEECRNKRDWKAAKDLVFVIEKYLDFRGYWTERQIVLEIGLKAAKNQEKKSEESLFLGKLGNVYHRMGKSEKAINSFKKAISISRKSRNKILEIDQLNRLGSVYIGIGKWEEGLRYCEVALSISRKIEDRKNEGAILTTLGIAYNNLKEHGKAIKYFKEALQISQGIGDKRRECENLGFLGSISKALGDTSEALEYFEKSLALSREIGDKRNEANMLDGIGTIHCALKQFNKAVKYHRLSLDINQEIGHQLGESGNFTNLGVAYAFLGKVEKEIECYKQALAISRRIGNNIWEGLDLRNIGIAYYKKLEHENAKEYLKPSLSILEELKSPYADEVRELLLKIDKGKSSVITDQIVELAKLIDESFI